MTKSFKLGFPARSYYTSYFKGEEGGTMEPRLDHMLLKHINMGYNQLLVGTLPTLSSWNYTE